MIETIITICALTMAYPYYDCNSEWDIKIYDESVKTIPNTESAVGTATWKKTIFSKQGGTISLVHNYKTAVGKHDHLLKGGGVLWHEILHMQCKCDWHAHWDVLEGIEDKRHSRTKIPPIPASVRPYLNIG